MKVGILGCGAIANIITNFAVEGKLGVDLNFFYDRDMERAENLASQVDGTVALDINSMLENVDLVIEAAAPQAVSETVPLVLEHGVDVIIMSIGALMDTELRKTLENLAAKNNAKIYAPSGAIVGLDGIKAASIGKIQSATLVTRKPPRSLGVSAEEETILYEGKAGDAVRKFPMNINVAAALSLACGKEVDVKIIADPSVDRNMHEVQVIGDFGEIKTITQNVRCSMNPKTSVMAAYSAIKLLNSLNETFRIGT
ncbi:L-aspartate dehydrogenase [Methanobacterium lacus]|jgi:aspartate dehydrogenase|uniref:L-aspartate dehydrogenase n=1 Tax=Methanobacterium lacus (strain AL-21) TaxID=877455 RepID=F0T949_METLA|nr:aspartate dehydrogenase [Methanobacterium lacus]ADZ08671.1 L-aspartate dehydrogenase [Methanobacterium lacus]